MLRRTIKHCLVWLLAVVLVLPASAQQGVPGSPQQIPIQGGLQEPVPQQPGVPSSFGQQDTERLRLTYVLGPNDQLLIRVPEAEEVHEKVFRIDAENNLTLPLVGILRAGGMTLQQLEDELTKQFSKYVRTPHIRITVIQYRSDPVFLVGAFRSPGIYPLQGNRSLIEVLTTSGGLQPGASKRLRITRRLDLGKLPLPNAVEDPERNVSVATVSINRLMETVNPEEDVELKPYDVLRVGNEEMIYISGEVGRTGGIPLADRDYLSLLQAVSLSGGLSGGAAPEKARILRPILDTAKRAEIPVDVRAIMNGTANDFPLLPNDILVIPRGRSAKSAMLRYVYVAVPALITSSLFLVLRGRRN